MKEYLKMSDGFYDLDIGCLEQRLFSGLVSKEECTYAAHAINSHDELVEINKYLLSKLEEIDECFEAAYIDGLSDALANEDIYTIKDIYCRRIEFARGVAVSAICKENK